MAEQMKIIRIENRDYQNCQHKFYFGNFLFQYFQN